MVITTTSDVTELARGGRIRILAVSGRERSPFLPDVPTFTEAGIAIAGGAWYGLFAKAGSPPEILGRISRAVMAAMRDAAVKEKVLGLAMVPTGSTPEELGRVQRQDIADWTPAVKASGFRPT